MDPSNDNEFVAKEKVKYWQNVDLYIGGAEHATGHLLYARFWTKFLYDLNYIPFEEPFQKMINQGMIQGNSAYVYRVMSYTHATVKADSEAENIPHKMPEIIISENVAKILTVHPKDHTKELLDERDYYRKIIENLQNKHTHRLKTEFPNNVGRIRIDDNKFVPVPIDINLVKGSNELDIEGFRKWRPNLADAEIIKDRNDKFYVFREVEKMSKSKYNVQTPDELVEKYGADTLRCYEMFLGPLEQHKPWDTQGITGVHGFLKKLWRLYHSGENETFYVDETPILKSVVGSPPPSGELEGALKSLHKTIKKVKEDIERFSFNTPVSAFMICVNELTTQKCNKRAILEPLLIILAPYAPHIAEELWHKMGNKESITYAVFPKYNEKYLTESSHKYPISFNGKMKFLLELPLTLSKEEIEKEVLANEQTQKYLAGKTPKKVIVIPKKIVNMVI